MKFDERNKKKIKITPFFFLFHMATAAKFILLISIFLAYLVPLDVDMTGNITAQLCEVWSVFNIFCTLVTMAAAVILIFFQPQKLPHTRKFNERNPIFF
jgi:positive regulator of sigma E activity